MKPTYKIFLMLAVTASMHAASQMGFADSALLRHNRIHRNALKVITGWSVASIASGVIGQNNSTGETRQFHKKNVLWGGVNLGLAGFGFLRVKPEGRRQFSTAEIAKKLRTTEKIFLFNTGLDLAYVALGLYTRERGLRFTGDKRDRLHGTGSSLMTQGGFLTLFDGVVYLLHTKNGSRFNDAFNRLTVTVTMQGAGLVYRF